jgi:hypothetical protein
MRQRANEPRWNRHRANPAIKNEVIKNELPDCPRLFMPLCAAVVSIWSKTKSPDLGLFWAGSAMQSPKGEAWWAHKGSNLGPLPCEGNALPLSYAPGRQVEGQSRDLRSGGQGCQAQYW